MAEKTTETVNDAAEATADSVESLWRSIDKHRLVNRSWDEVIAWLLMGVLVGSTAGLFTKLKTSGLGRLGRLGLGLAGALLGGMVVRVGQISFDWGVVVIPYEELLFSLIGAILLIVAWRLLAKLMRAKKPTQD